MIFINKNILLLTTLGRLLRCGAISARNVLMAVLIGGTSLVMISGPQAQTAPRPDAGQILRESQPGAPLVPTQPAIPEIKAPTPAPTPPAPESDSKIRVDGIKFTGNSAFSDETLQAIVADSVGQRLDFGQLIQLIERVEARYKAAGYFLAQAYLPPQKIKDGTIEVAITEGRLGETRIEGESSISADVVFGYLDQLEKGKALTLPPLERQVLLINDLAGSKATLDMQAGSEAGTTDIVIAQKPDVPFNGRLEVSNHGSASTGEKRIGLNLISNSAFHQGERLTVSLLTTDTINLRSYNVSYDHPLGGKGLRLAATISRAEYNLGANFAALKGSGTSDSLRLGLGYPIIRSRTTNLRVQVEADRAKLNDQLQALGSDFNKGSRGLTFSTSFDTLDELGGGGSNRAEIKVKAGIISLSAGAAAPETDGSFNKTSLSLSRQQTVSKSLSANFQLSHQLASKNLDSSEKFGAGGPSSMPGYANGVGSGDVGNLLRLNLRWQANPDLGLSLFVDQAHLRLSHSPAPTLVGSNYKILKDYGATADWNIGKGLSLNALLGWVGVIDESTPIVAGSDYFRPRLWLSLAWGW